MKTKINVMRAVTATVAKRALIIVTAIATTILGLIFLGIWALAYFFSDWWWLLLIPYLPILFICLIIFLFSRFIVHQLYPVKLSSEQKKLLNAFTDKIQRLLEARGIGWPFFALLNVKDILFHRELRTTKDLISDTTSLQRDFLELEKKL